MIRITSMFFVVVSLVLLHPVWLGAVGKLLVSEDPIAEADVLLPLAGDERRFGFAADLYRSGYANQLIIARLPLETEAARAIYLRRALDIVTGAGVPFDAISIVPGVASTTYGEAANVRRFMERENLRSVIVVTNPWHTRRTRIVFRDAFRSSGIDVFVRSIEPRYRSEAWWKSPDDRRRTVSEYVKLLAHVAGIR